MLIGDQDDATRQVFACDFEREHADTLEYRRQLRAVVERHGAVPRHGRVEEQGAACLKRSFSLSSASWTRIVEGSHIEMKVYFSPFAVLLAGLVFSLSARAAETKIAMKDLPVPVQKAIEEQSKGTVIRGFTKEVENGKTEYEAQLTVNGHGKDISFDSAGNLLSVEEEVKLENLPAAVRATVQKAAEGGTLRTLESVTEGGKSFYEASIRKGGKSSEVQVDENGGRIK